MYTEKLYCVVCKKEVDAEVYDLDGKVSYCPICHNGYREVSYEAHMRELADEAAVLSEFENETRPYLSAPANKGLQLTAGTRSFTRTHRYWNCPDIKNGPSNLSTSWENVDCPHCLVTGGQVSPFDTSGS